MKASQANPNVAAMDHPITFWMMIVGLIGLGVLAFVKMKVNIFPSLNTPRVYVFMDYIGMSPDQIEGFIVNELELYLQFVDGVKDIKSRVVQQSGLITLSFAPGTDMGQSISQVVAMSDRAMGWMPQGTLPPMIMRMDQGAVPLGYLVFRSEGHKTSIGEMGDLANNIVRPLIQKKVHNIVAMSPFGPNMRSIIINVDPRKLLEYNLNPQDVVDALNKGMVVVPSGNVYVKDQMPIVHNDATLVDIQRLGNIPLRLGLNVYMRDVATFQDSTDITYGYALVDGEEAVHLPIIKKPEGSALRIVDETKKNLPIFNKACPPDVNITFEFDETPTVMHSVESVATEGAIGAGLTGLMILLFLHDWKAVLVVVTNIPLALTGSLVGLWLTKNTINIMSLGGMSLAIGILVDEATVEIENAHVQMEKTDNMATAVAHGNRMTAAPRLLALLCIGSVFIPAFIMSDPLRALFTPLALAVAFAQIASYFLSSTFVPIMLVYLGKSGGGEKDKGEKKPGLFDRVLAAYRKIVRGLVKYHKTVVLSYLIVSGLVIGILGLELGTALFPEIDMGVFALRFRPPAGSSYELSREMGVKCLQEIEHEAGPENLEISLAFAGQVAPNFGIDNMVLFMRGPDDGWLRVKLKKSSDIKLKEFRERLRKVLPERVVPWMAQRLEKGGMDKDEAQQEAEKCFFGFEPGDIVSEVMSFGASEPLAITVVGIEYPKVREHAQKIEKELKQIPFLRDVTYAQTLDYPSIEVAIDRELAGLIGITPKHIERSLVMATSSTRFTNLNYWINPGKGFDYLVQVQVPPLRMDSPSDLEELPLQSVDVYTPLMLRDVIKDGRVKESVRPGEYDRDMAERYLPVYANVHGEDMGRAVEQVRQAVKKAGKPPRGIRVEEQGQIPKLTEMFKMLGLGLGVAVFVILVMLTAYFQSPSMAIASLGAVPGVLAGIVLMLYFTGTTLNIESFMGSVMCLGVSASNSVLMVTFMDEHWNKGMPTADAAIKGASERMRPIVMTACAMSIGMVPMSLGLEKGSEMEIPLGRAVIGGLVMSTFSTLLVIPSIFMWLIRSKEPHSPSIYPENPDSEYHDPDFWDVA